MYLWTPDTTQQKQSLWALYLFANHVAYLPKVCCTVEGLKLHVDDEMLSGGKSVGDVLPLLANRSDSFVVGAAMASGDRATLPGVMLGSSSIVLIWEPCARKLKILFFVSVQNMVAQITRLPSTVCPARIRAPGR